MLRDLIAQTHIVGAESEHAELTRWSDPKEHPEEGKMVLVKRTVDSPLAYDLDTSLMESGLIHGAG